MKKYFAIAKEEFKSKDIVRISAMLSYILLVVFMCDCAFAGAGRLISFGPVTFRMLIFAGIVVVSLPVVFSKLKELIKNPMFLGLLVFFFFLIIAAVVGINSGNRRDVLISDLKGYMYFAIVPCVLCVLNSKEKIIFAMKAIAVSSFILAVTALVLHFMVIASLDFYKLIYKPVDAIMFGTIHRISPTIFRVFPKSIPYLAVGGVFSMNFLFSSKKINWFWSAVVALNIWAIIISYTRSIFGGAAIAFMSIMVLWLIFNRDAVKMMAKSIGAITLIFAILTALICIPTKTNYISYAITRTAATLNTKAPVSSSTTGSDDMEERKSNGSSKDDYISDTITSDEYRKETTRQLWEMIDKNPIMGNGLGAAIEQRKDGFVEDIYLDILNKMGAVGLVAYFLPILIMAFLLVRAMAKKHENLNILIAVFSGLLVFLFATAFNPYMNASIGIGYLSFSMGVFTYEYNKTKRIKS